MNARWMFALAFIVAVDPAFAHDLPFNVTGFPAGLLHPLVVPEHLLVLVGLGLLIGQQPHPRLVLLAIPAIAYVIGAGLLETVLADSLPEPAFDAAFFVLLGAAAICGALVVLSQPVPNPITLALAALVGFAIALGSVPDEISAWAALLVLAGIATSVAALMLLVVGITATRKRHWERIGVRVLGSWITAGAIMVLALGLMTQLQKGAASYNPIAHFSPM